MTPLQHIAILREILNRQHAPAAVFAEYLEDFADDHHRGMEQWFEKEWADLLLAETQNEKKKALDKLGEQYHRIENMKEK
jgi:uridine kinase